MAASMAVCKCVYGGCQRYSMGAERPELRSIGLLIGAQIAHAPHTVPEIAPLSRTRNRNPF